MYLIEAKEEVKKSFRSYLLNVDFCYSNISRDIGDFNGTASVLILLDFREWQILLNIRSKELRRHPGEVCFPGGMGELDLDQGPIQTALRETYEELGVNKDQIHVIGILPAFLTRYKMLIYPVVAVLDPEDSVPYFHLSAEVDATFWEPLKTFLNSKNHALIEIASDFSIHAFFVMLNLIILLFKLKKPVYGVTSMLCIFVAMVIYNQYPSFELKHVNLYDGKSLQENLKQLFAYYGTNHKCLSKNISKL